MAFYYFILIHTFLVSVNCFFFVLKHALPFVVKAFLYSVVVAGLFRESFSWAKTVKTAITSVYACTQMLTRSLWRNRIHVWQSKSGISTSGCCGHMTLPATCSGVERGVLVHMQSSSSQETWFQRGSADLWHSILIELFHHSESQDDCWTLIFLQSAFATVAGLQLGSSAATHAQQKAERNRNLSRGCLILTPHWQDAVCQLEEWSYEPLSNQISVKWHQIDTQRYTKIIG